MPLYDFRCQQCDTVFERALPVSAPKEGVECPQCHERDTHRLYSAFAIGKSARSAGATAPACGGGG